MSEIPKDDVQCTSLGTGIGMTPETLRELAQYLRNCTRLFPSPRSTKAYEWLTVKAAQTDDHASAWEVDRKRLEDARSLLARYLAGDDILVEATAFLAGLDAALGAKEEGAPHA
jgi:hypothetical protein